MVAKAIQMKQLKQVLQLKKDGLSINGALFWEAQISLAVIFP
jgi:hypothetical protein